jgi:lipopolysaccharide export system protein LptA
VTFHTRALVRSGIDEVHGNYILYDGLTEQYLVTAAPGARPGSEESRVRAVIQPKNAGNGGGNAPSPANR